MEAETPRPGAVVIRLLRNAPGGLPERWRAKDGKLADVAREEAFWALASHLIASSMLGMPLKDHVAVGRDSSSIRLEVSGHDWDALRTDLGLAQLATRELAIALLNGELLLESGDNPSGRPGLTICEELSGPTTALVLLTLLLRQRSAPRGAPDYSYRVGDLKEVAASVRGWPPLGDFDEASASRALFAISGGERHSGRRSLFTPLHAYWGPLVRRIPAIRPPTRVRPVAPDEELPLDFLLDDPDPSEPVAEATPEPSPAPEPVTPPPSDNGDLKRTIDRLRRSDPGPVLVGAWAPLLAVPGDPLEALASQVDAADGLTLDLLKGLQSALTSGAVELIGDIGETLELELPHEDYKLAWVGPRRGSLRRGAFRVSRRGLRVHGRVLAPAQVAPVKPRR